ncbi:TetR/AcrR family transcriptional regulator [Paenibacillus sp. NPDC058174]|uniref:TetR/AcrR family transcriptional regulator n=1 Tax=Paenibacillus sp. NPDC058174 TaxID=3346366 RepID=UPI0036DBBC76
MFEKYNKVQQAVLQTTLQIINEKELQATSMALIAKQSGVSTGSIYHYFSSKEDIINELYKGIVKFNGEFVTNGLDTDEPVRVRFERAWKKVFELCMTYPLGFQFIEQYSFSPYIYDSSKQEAYAGGWCGRLAKLYADAIGQGLMMDMEPKQMVQMNYGSIVYLVKGHLEGYFNLNEETIQSVIDSSWKAVSR